jgi:putative peptidoglycan lipid II flippase
LEKPEAKQSVVKSAVFMSLGTVASRVLGYVRDALVLSLFSRMASDAYLTAFRLPNLMRRLLGEGSLSISFIPIYVDQLVRDPSHKKSDELANAVLTLLFSLTTTLSILLFIFMDPLVRAWVGNEAGYAAVPGKIELTITLAKVMSAYMMLVTTYAFLMSISNALQKFFIPALAPAAFNLIAIIFSLLPGNPLLPGIMLAWGVVVGGVVQTAMVAFQLYLLGRLPRLSIKIRVEGLWPVLRNMAPGLIGLGIYQVMTVANTFFAARLEEGAQSYLYTADRILEFPQSLIAVSLGTALLPMFSRQLSRGDKAGMLATAEETMRAMLFLALPSAVGMYVLSHPIIEVLFFRGTFGAKDVALTASILEVYSVLLVFSSLTKVTVPGFYALKNTWLPAVVAGLALSVHLILANRWVNEYGLSGLAGATAVSGALNMIVLQIAFRHMIGPLNWWRIFGAVTRMVPALAVMAVLVHFAFIWSEPVLARGLGETLGRVVALGLTIGAAIFAYMGVASLFGCVEADRTLSVVRRRLGRGTLVSR